MRPLLLAAIATSILLVAGSCSASKHMSEGPTSGLTSYGRAVWNLDALLHDTFGQRHVWENYAKSNIPDFTTQFLDLARSVPYAYTFANAHHSAYRLVRTKHPPTIATYVTGEDFPLMISGSYISCGGDLWLYEHSGQALPGGDLECAKSHRG